MNHLESEMSGGIDPTIINSTIVSHDVTNVAIENYDFEQFISLFHKIEININDFWLVNIGVNASGEKKLVYLIIRAYATKPFFGPHLVSIFIHSEEQKSEMVTIWVHSLTFLRKELFQFQDRLSFERSTFLAPFHDSQTLIRLKSIRGFITIPFASINDGMVSMISPRKARPRERINLLLKRNIQGLITFLSRELDISMRESIIELGDYVDTYCKDLINQFT
jgi:hypothetical protein